MYLVRDGHGVSCGRATSHGDGVGVLVFGSDGDCHSTVAPNSADTNLNP